VRGREIALGPCWAHGGLFEFDAGTVCTIWVTRGAEPVAVPEDTPGARQVLVCDPCMEQVNKIRAAAGLPPHRLAREMEGGWAQ
jgi:hypothetical protein